ncbi:VOC family protein [Candidatus Dojkabacteria bacterium]|nr:VOC family protein [Candidatus Dojkabacteria bacterium]
MKNTNSPVSFGIHIKCQDFDGSYAFYRNFGFKEVFAYGPEEFLRGLDGSIPTAKENYRGVSFQVGDAILEIADGHVAVKPEVFKEVVTSSKISAMVDVESLDVVEKVCRNNNYKIVAPRKEYPWGMTELVVKDPDGFVLVFRQKTDSE